MAAQKTKQPPAGALYVDTGTSPPAVANGLAMEQASRARGENHPPPRREVVRDADSRRGSFLSG